MTISLSDLGKRFNYDWIFRHVNYQFENNNVYAITGSNGSGKSTLLRTIAGIIKPDKGSVIVKGTFAPILAIGAGLESELTGYENIHLLLALYGTARKNTNAVENIREFSELSDEVLRAPVKQYSSGMLARLAFSISLANDSDILIIDEVMAVGDQGFQGKCVKKIYDIKEQGKTILYVSHFPDDVARICNKAVLLEGGEVIHSGDSQEICQKYSNLF